MKTERLPQLDGLRGIAILGVLLVHYSFALPPSSPKTPLSLLEHALSFGWMGVDLFFVLSGFLIGGILISNRHERAGGYFKTFYVRRFCRIVPLYGVALLIGVTTNRSAHLGPVFSESESGHYISWLWYLTFTQNFPAALHELRWFGQSWSLAVEEQFYLLIPLVIWLIPDRRILRSLAVLIILSIGLRLVLFIMLPGADVSKLLPSQMDVLLIGVACAWLIAAEPKLLHIHRAAITVVALATGLIMLGFVALNWNYWSPQMITIGLSFFAVHCGCIIILAVIEPKGRLASGLVCRYSLGSGSERIFSTSSTAFFQLLPSTSLNVNTDFMPLLTA